MIEQIDVSKQISSLQVLNLSKNPLFELNGIEQFVGL